MLTLSSSAAAVISFPSTNKPTFAEARNAWREALKDAQLTNAEFRFVVEFCAFFNRKHFEKTGELMAWPKWETLIAKTGLSKMTIHRATNKFEHLRALEVERHRYNHTTKKRAHNIYCVPARFLMMSLSAR